MNTTNGNGAVPPTFNSNDTKDVLGLLAIALPDTFTAVTAKKQLTTIEIGRPNPMKWCMVHPQFVVPRVAIVQMQEERGQGVYIVLPGMLKHVAEKDIKVAALYLATTTDGAVFFWLVREGDDSWASSMRQIVELAHGTYVRVQSDRANGRYIASTPQGDLPEPVWPKESFEELVTIACKNRTIDTPDHPVIKVLNGTF